MIELLRNTRGAQCSQDQLDVYVHVYAEVNHIFISWFNII